MKETYHFARDWIVWAFTGYSRGCLDGVYRWWSVRDYLESSMRICETLMLARMILEEE